MKQLTEVAVKKLSQKGCLAIQFNARDHLSWEFLRNLEVTLAGTGISFRGTFPLRYSANSVVQDNREGALTTDYVLMFGPNDAATDAFSFLPGWTSDYPVNLKEEKCL
jgi:hypothetical protein